MKQKYKWLIEIADKKPLLFIVLMLLIAVGSLTVVVENLYSGLNDCRGDNNLLQKEYNERVSRLNDEVKDRLNDIIVSYKTQLEQQKRLNDSITTTINENKKIIKSTKKATK